LVDAETILLEEPAVGVAPGQTAVMYEGEDVTAAGTIVSTEGWGCSSATGLQNGGLIGPVV
jgi:hypothetical protein